MLVKILQPISLKRRTMLVLTYIKKINDQYISSNCNAAIDDIKKDIQIDNYDTDKKSNSHEVVDNISSKAKTEGWPRATC